MTYGLKAKAKAKISHQHKNVPLLFFRTFSIIIIIKYIYIAQNHVM